MYIIISILGWFVVTTFAIGQEEELALIEEVESLQRQLASADVLQRDQAETGLLKLGPQILDYLDPPDEDASTDYRERILRLRTQLEKDVVSLTAQPTTVTFRGEMTLMHALEKIRQQTSNDVRLADEVLSDHRLELQFNNTEFWTALDQIMTKSGLEVDCYGSNRSNSLVLRPAGMNRQFGGIPTASSMILQAQVLRVDSSVNLIDPQLGYTNLELLVRWEPRLRPISVDIPLSKVRIRDEFGEQVNIPNPQRIVYGMVQPETPEIKFTLSLPRVDRKFKMLHSLTAQVNTLIPGQVATFRFKKIASLRHGFQLQKAGATVIFQGFRKNGDVYTVRISLAFDEDNKALESHQGWVYQNEIYLQDKAGNREEAISMETIRQDNRQVAVQYLFLNEPGERTLVYKTPATIVKLPVTLEMANIPLP